MFVHKHRHRMRLGGHAPPLSRGYLWDGAFRVIFLFAHLCFQKLLKETYYLCGQRSGAASREEKNKRPEGTFQGREDGMGVEMQ